MNSKNALAGVIASILMATAAIAQEATTAQPEEDATFDLWEIRVLGNSTLSNATIEQAVYPFLGPRKSIKDVDAARQALEKAFRDAGYGTVFVDIPEQQTDGGVVRLAVTEGRLDRVRITGARYFSNKQIRAALPALQAGSVPHLPAVQSQLAALNRSTPDRSVVPVLRAGRMPGTVDAELKVADELPVHGTLEVNDRYTANTSRWRLTASLSYHNLFQAQHSLSFQYQTAPEAREDVQVLVGTYAFRVDALPDTTFALYAVDSETDVAALGTLSVLGDGRIYGARAIQSLPMGANYFHSITFGADYKDFLENIRLGDSQNDEDDGEDELLTPIEYINWSLVYAGTLRAEHSTTGLSVGLNWGIADVVNDQLEFAGKRFNGQANYFYLTGSAEHGYTLPFDWQLYGRVDAQFTQSALVSNEQFAIGGADTVRGYLESTSLGDYGANATVEVRNGWLLKALQLPVDAAHLFVFYDAGTAAIIDPLPSQRSRFDLTSAGVGLRVNGWRGLDVSVEWATALRDSGDVASGDDRTHVLFRYAF